MSLGDFDTIAVPGGSQQIEQQAAQKFGTRRFALL